MVIALVSTASARAQDSWTITTSDFKTESVEPRSIDASGVTVAAADGTTRLVPTSALVQLTKTAPKKSPAGLVLCVAGGERLVGTPLRLDGQNLVWFTAGVGEIAVPVESCLGILRDRVSASGLNDARTEDEAKLSTGDAVKGILTDVAADAFTFTPSAGEPIKVTPAAVASILFAAPPGGRKPTAPPAFLVSVSSGSVVACREVTFDGKELGMTTASGATARAPWAQIDAVEHTGGAVAWLSMREPTESIHTPYFDGQFPARMDSSVGGGPIRFRGVTYARGIGVHSRSRITFAVQPGDVTFRTRYAIDGNQPNADVDVAIYLDAERVHQKTGVKAGVLSPLVELKLGDAKTITLEVDYGGGYDVQDRLNWIEPAVIREAKP